MKYLLITLCVSLSLFADSGQRSQRIKQVFNELRKDNMHILDEFYAEQMKFEDPISTVNGLNEMKAYYLKMYDSVKEIRFDFSDELIKDDVHIVVWTMTLQTANSLNGGEPFSVQGNSYIKFGSENKVVYHRDYFDAGAMLYEKLPGIGFIIRKIKAQFH